MPAAWDTYLVSLLVKLAAMASIASVLARSGAFKALLLRENRDLRQRLSLALWLSVVFGASVATRVVSRTYQGADLGLEGSLLAGVLGGYVTGLTSGIVISLPAVFAHERLTMPLLNIYGQYDHLVPPEACEVLTTKVGSRDTENVCLDTGHVGIYVSSRFQKETVPKIAAWLLAREG